MLFSPDGTMVVSTNRDTTVTRWDVESATPLETLRGHSNFVQQPVFSPDGESSTRRVTTERRSPGISRATAGSGGRSRSRATGSSRGPAMTATRGDQPRRSVDRGRPQGAGRRALGRSRADPRRAAPPRHGRRGQVARLLTGWANACGGDQALAHAVGRWLAIAARRPALRGEPFDRSRRRFQSGWSDPRYRE